MYKFFYSLAKAEVCVIGLQFPGSLKSPSFGKIVIVPFVHELGIIPVSMNVQQSLHIICATLSIRSLQNRVFILFTQLDLLTSLSFINFETSFNVYHQRNRKYNPSHIHFGTCYQSVHFLNY